MPNNQNTDPATKLVSCNSHSFFLVPSLFTQFAGDPRVSDRQPFAQQNLWFPAKNLAKPAIVAVAAAYTLRTAQVVTLGQFLAGNIRDDIHQLIDGHQFVCTEVERVAIIGSHDADQAFHAVVNVHERTGLLAIAPYFDLAAVLSQGDLA